ncbi:MAG: hypothetical protein SVR08_04190 [Spirochaetota bacterium]|nr:hypothetical protein [Spirochaetota bacterium]
MKSFKVFSLLLSTIILIASSAYAKDLSGRLGFGFTSQFSPNLVDAVSAKYWLNSNLCFQGIFGALLNSDATNEIDLGGKVLFKIKDEENMHLLVGGRMGIAYEDPDQGDSVTTVSLGGLIGIEFFLSGLPNLSFSTEIGAGIANDDDNTSIGFDADTFLTAGIHYYF